VLQSHRQDKPTNSCNIKSIVLPLEKIFLNFFRGVWIVGFGIERLTSLLPIERLTWLLLIERPTWLLPI
jgi:hypothetical protein